jgi:hypothetical protein
MSKLIKKMSLIDLTNKYQNDEDECRDYFFSIKYPDGFVCRKCGHTHYTYIHTNKNYQCKNCQNQESIKSNTIMQDSKLPLFYWLYAIYRLSVSKSGVSAEDITNELGISRKASQLLCRKIKYAMCQRNNEFKLSDTIELDGGFIGTSTKNGKRGLGTDKQPFLFGVSYVGPTKKMYCKIQAVEGENEETIYNYLKDNIDMDFTNKIITDAKRSYNFISNDYMDVTHQSQIIDHDDPNNKIHKWLHTLIGNMKTFVEGTYHGLEKKYMSMAFGEFEWRFNRRKMRGDSIIKSLTKAVLCANIMTRENFVDMFNSIATETGY